LPWPGTWPDGATEVALALSPEDPGSIASCIVSWSKGNRRNSYL
jgi:hypothetical protein